MTETRPAAAQADDPAARPPEPHRTVRVVVDANDDPYLSRRLAALEAADRIVVCPNPVRSSYDLVWDVLAGAGKNPAAVRTCRLSIVDLHPADLTPYTEAVYGLPRYHDTQCPPEDPGADADATAVLNALAHAGRPLTADYLAESLRWTYDRTADALAHAWARPDLGGPGFVDLQEQRLATGSGGSW
ncbi:hypothetical protein OHA79_03370 [Streptomyces sp. NBC_00841]|uniref:hypothetical protein n=1 Tax=Streptomyces sp. NBC_00841 TaxID=2975847 RepID=UPI002DD86B01|nr:hypothetical protein [Streptomyces sp. NBC_00841]WRZ97050.1 hypothetical protein OHA79_03370 [Streptomyces sp. NBC_00841]